MLDEAEGFFRVEDLLHECETTLAHLGQVKQVLNEGLHQAQLARNDIPVPAGLIQIISAKFFRALKDHEDLGDEVDH